MTEPTLPRFCRETQQQLPFLVSGELTGWGARVVRGHARRCPRCGPELTRQQEVARALGALRDNRPEPPADLLDRLLARPGRRSLRERAAVPARGAVSGARPALSVAFVTAGAVTSTAVGYAAWRGLRKLRGKS
jgi:predicted anti-sigma-YlaC factor YlaD